MITYEIEGTPRPQGSKRNVGNGIMVEASKYLKEWRAFARLKAVEAMRNHQMIQKPRPVNLVVVFGFDRPQKHFKRGVLRDDAPTFHTSRPDTDKLLRALFDSMSEVVFKDDSQVCGLVVSKIYQKGAVTRVTVGVGD